MTATRAATLAVNAATYVAWNSHDADAVAAVFAEDAVLREARLLAQLDLS
jgi:ketosteroid isomerase-like protein